MTPISGWDILDSILVALPLGIVVFSLTLVGEALNPSLISNTTTWAIASFVVALQFAYQMNQLINPRYTQKPSNSTPNTA